MEECKDLGKLAKQKERETPSEAVEIYMQAADCFGAKDNLKDKNANLEKAAKLLREFAKSIKDPNDALVQFEKSSSIYADIDKQAESEKVMQEVHQKFIDSAKILKSEASKTEVLEQAVQKLKNASEYALKGNNEQLHNECWIDSGDFYLKSANQIQDPREALEIYKEAVGNYKQGKDKKKQDTTLASAAENFTRKGNEIYKTQKTLVLALDNYIQAFTLYQSINSDEKASQNQKKAQEICEMIGIPQDSITNYLESQGILSISSNEAQQTTSEIEIPKAELVTTSDQVAEEEKEKEELIVTDKVFDTEIELESEVQEIPPLEFEKPVTEEITETNIEVPIVNEKMSEPGIETPPIQQEIIEPDSEIENSASKVPEVDLEITSVAPETSEQSIEVPAVKQEVLEPEVETPAVKQEVLEPEVETPTVKQEVLEPEVETPAVKQEVLEPEVETPAAKQEISESSNELSDDTLDIKKPDFLEDFDFENKEGSAIKDRIKSELRGQDRGPSTNIEKGDKKTADIENLFDDALDESMEDFLSDFDDVIIVEKGGKPVITGPIIEILREQGYIKEDLSKEEELQKVPEYQILLIIIKEHPIPLETIEGKTDIESVSMVISNLQADNLIVQTNDYQWTISQKVKDNIREFMSQTGTDGKSKIEKLRSTINRNSKYEHLLIVTLFKLGVIPELDVSVMELMQIPEFAALKTIKDKEPADFDIIKEVISDMPPVQITRMLSRLESEERITQNTNGQWKLSDKLAEELIVNKE